MHAVTAEEMYAIDRYTIDVVGMPGVVLMENAGHGIVRKAMSWIKKEDKIAVLVGTGNNGGDGFVIARYLLELGFKVDLWLIPPKEKIKGDALVHMRVYENAGYQVKSLTDIRCLSEYNVIFDAMLGIGVKGEVRSPYRDVIKACNDLDCLKVAVDIPSGVPADGNQWFELAFEADVTFTLHCPKLSAYIYSCAHFYGQLEVVDIGIPAISKPEAVNKTVWHDENVHKTFPIRNPFSHKGSNGKGLVVGGSQTMIGAPVMSAKAALRSGIGLLTVAIPSIISSSVTAHLVESTFSLWNSTSDGFNGEIGCDLTDFDAIAVGPGLGRTNEVDKIITILLQDFAKPLVIDADALYHLKDHKELLMKRTSPTVLTPHTGEMSRLTGISAQEINENRFKISYDFATTYGVYLVLKGPNTIVTTPTGEQYINSTGNASLAKGGSGDVLTGIILGYLLQHDNIQAALSNAVFIHGKAADYLVEKSHSVLDVIASDIIECIPTMHRQFTDKL